MSFMDKLKGEFIDIIEWNDDQGETVVWRFPRFQDEIKNGAKLTVRPSQIAVFVNEGKVADLFLPGMHALETKNLPVLSTLKGWKHGFDSPFKAEVYFVSTRLFTDLKWGTRNPVIARDAELGMVRLRAFGNLAIQVVDARKLVEEIAGTKASFAVEDIREQLRTIVNTRFSDMVASSQIPILDLSTHYDELSKILTNIVAQDFQKFGFSCSQLLIENISLPPEVESAIDKRSSIGAIGNLDQFAKYQAATALEAAAKNPGNAAGTGIGLAMGLGMAGQVAGIAASGAGQPPPLPMAWWVALGGQQNGPHDVSSLQRLIAGNQLTKETLVWKEGMPHWIPCATIPELAKLFP